MPQYRFARIAAATLLLAACAEAAAMACDLSASAPAQAQCLLRTGQSVGDRVLPPELRRLVGRPAAISGRALRTALQKRRIAPRDIGGDLGEPLSQTAEGRPARYFIIHDTSFPVFAAGYAFPKAIDSAAWNRITLSQLVSADRARNYGAHLYIDRRGGVAATVNLSEARLSTKAERLEPELVGLFIAIECLQPRGLNAAGRDLRVPKPAFTAPQLDTLALAYIVASYRARQWLIPGFHSGVDAGIPEAHDDPRGFDLRRWSARVGHWAAQVALRARR